jgi:hypothetical protein
MSAPSVQHKRGRRDPSQNTRYVRREESPLDRSCDPQPVHTKSHATSSDGARFAPNRDRTKKLFTT